MTWVVKIGGSLANDEVLREWLEICASHGGGRVVIVPGGGPFSDIVREAQESWHFNDAVAHRMAILAMEQFGLMLSGISPALVPVESLNAVRAVLRTAGVAVWLPATMTKGAMDLPASWSVTSDSLAAWLAKSLNAQRLVLVKSCPLPEAPQLNELVASGAVDQSFPAFIAGQSFETLLLSKTELPTMRSLLLGKDAPSAHRLIVAGPRG